MRRDVILCSMHLRRLCWLCTLLVLLNACQPASFTATPSATSIGMTPVQIDPPTVFPSLLSPTPLSPTVTPAWTPQPATPSPCDPYTQAFCVEASPFPLQRPIRPPANDTIARTYPFGSTAHGRRDPHHGVEFVNPAGTPVYAAATGEVIFAGPDLKAIYSPWRNFYGNLIVLRHRQDLFTLYAHLSRIEVQPGQIVRAGEPIGQVGASGSALGSHLHFEVRLGQVEEYDATVNPELWLQPRPGRGVLAIAVVNARGEFRPARCTVRRLTPDGSSEHIYFLNTYEATFSHGQENGALGDLPEGLYRLVCEIRKGLYDRQIEVKSGQLTRVAFVIP